MSNANLSSLIKYNNTNVIILLLIIIQTNLSSSAHATYMCYYITLNDI